MPSRSVNIQALENRFILTQVSGSELTFPANWVTEIMVVERTNLLRLPFYNPMVLGVIQSQGRVVMLLSARYAFFVQSVQAIQDSLLAEQLTAIRLNANARGLEGVAFVVDRVVGTLSEEQIQTRSNKLRAFDPQEIPGHVWQPQRWAVANLNL